MLNEREVVRQYIYRERERERSSFLLDEAFEIRIPIHSI